MKTGICQPRGRATLWVYLARVSETNIAIDAETFFRVAAVYVHRWSVSLQAADPDGRLIFGETACPKAVCAHCQAKRRIAISASLRWGDPTVEPCTCGLFLWAVPLMRNQQVLGGLVAAAIEGRLLPDVDGKSAIDSRAACTDLRLLAERENLTNASYLQQRREEYLREQLKADALHEFKVAPPYDSIREMFLRQEPSLLAAIRRKDRPAARQIINNMLVAMLQRAGENVSVTKTFFLELVVMMCRTAVETGGNPEQLLGADFHSLSELSTITSYEDLAQWLHLTLDHVMDTISAAEGRSAIVPLSEALEFMAEHLGEDISRDDIARAAHLSPHHFSRLFRRELGISCSDRLNQMRVERAAELLVASGLPLARISHACGFSDQSYFTKVFRKQIGQTPKAYREQRTGIE